MLTHIEILVLCNLIVEDFDEYDFNDFFFQNEYKNKT